MNWRLKTALALMSVGTFDFLLGSPLFAQDRIPGATSNPGQFRNVETWGGYDPGRDLKFTHLNKKDGLSQDDVFAIYQDHRGFLWFATGEGLNRYDGKTFVAYKNNPEDPGTLSHNSIRDIVEDDRGYLWVAAHPGVNRFDPRTERSVRYAPDPHNSNSLGSDAVWRITRDSHGYLWFAEDTGLDRFDPATETFTHYRNDANGDFVGRITHVLEDSQGEIWFVGELGLFHLDVKTGRISRAPGVDRIAANYIYEDTAGAFWMLAHFPTVGLVKYDRQARRLTTFPFGPGAAGLESTTLLSDAENGFWVPSNLGLYYFDRRNGRFTHLFQHDVTNPDSLSDNNVVPIYRDRAGLLWIGTQNGGLNVIDFQQQQFGRYTHRWADPNSLDPGTANAIYQDPKGILWVGILPRTLERLDRNTGNIRHYVAGTSKRELSKGGDISSILKDARGYLWIGGWGAGLDRFDERTGQFRNFRHNPADSHSLMTDNVVSLYADTDGHMWVGEYGGASRFDPATEQFTNYPLGADESSGLAYTVSAFQRDRSGTLWLGTWGGVLSRFDEKTNTWISFEPDQHDPHRLQGGSVGAIHEDRAGTLWVGCGLGLYRYNRQDGTFTRYTENQGLASNDVQGMLEDQAGALWLSTKAGISRFDPSTQTFRNYDVSDGLLSNTFSRSCQQHGREGEMLFCGTNGVTAFVPELLRDDPYAPPVVITSLKLFNKPVPIGATSVLKKAIPYVDSLTLSYQHSVFSFEFAALSYANSRKNRYRYKLENFDRGWNEVDSDHSSATYTNLNPGRYVFRVQGANRDGVWNNEGVTLPILITPPLWKTNWFRSLCGALMLGLLWAAYQLRVRQLAHEFNMRLEERIAERTRVARDLHDTLLQSFHAILLKFQSVLNLLPERPAEARDKLERALDQATEAVTEARDAVQGLRPSALDTRDLADSIARISEELTIDQNNSSSGVIHVEVEGAARELKPMVRDEVYRIACEALRNAVRHAEAREIAVAIQYDEPRFRLRVRDDGRGISDETVERQARVGHFGLPGMRERAEIIGGHVDIWSKIGSGTEVDLSIPANVAYCKLPRWLWLLQLFSKPSRDNGANTHE